MTLTQLSYILAVEKHQHFGAAAEACFVTQPTLSMQIQKLEEELSVLIFDRGRQPIRPTPIGKQILAQARIVVGEAQKLEILVKQEQTEVAGEIRFGIIPTLAPYLLPRFINRFIEKHPKARLVVEELQTNQIVEGLQTGSIDLGILVTPLHHPSVEEHVLFYEPFLLYVSSDHRLAKVDAVKEKDLSTNEIWLLNEGHCFRDQVLSICGDTSRIEKKNAALRFESGNLETLKKLVDQGSGYTLLPRLAADELTAKDRRERVKEFRSPVPTREVSLVHFRGYHRAAVASALAEEIKASVPKELLALKKGAFHRVDMPAFG